MLLQGDLAAFGLADGRLQLTKIGFVTQVLKAEDLPVELTQQFAGKEPGLALDHEDGVVQLTVQGQFREQKLAITQVATAQVGAGPIRRLHHVIGPGGPLIAALVEEPTGFRLQLIVGRERSNFLTGQKSVEFDPPLELPFTPLVASVPSHIALTGSGASLYLAWEDGSLLRLDLRDLDNVQSAEQLSLVPDGKLTAMGFVLGSSTLVWGDSQGRVSAGFLVRVSDFMGQGLPGIERNPQRPTTANELFLKTKALADQGSPVRSLAASARSRLLLTGFDNGEIQLKNVTNATTLATFAVPSGEPVLRLAMAPKEDGLVAWTRSGIFHAHLDPGYPEAGFAALFRPVWYEGYSEPQHVWQSSSSTDDFEMKLGLMPLIFGTIKATFYSLLFGAPLALLAAIFTSEFLSPRAKSLIKPSIELMASLPSVVLGFLAALVIAPFAEGVVPAILTGIVTLPLAFLGGAYLWQLLPVTTLLRLASWRIAGIALALPVGVGLAVLLGPRVESWLFAGDIKAWLSWEPGTPGQEQFASAVGGWMLLFLPLSAFLVALALGKFGNPWMRAQSARWSQRQFAGADAGKFLLGLTLSLGLALLLSLLCDALGLDPRGSYVDTFVQRNAMIVGFVMGFAVIPIIYTISEDALSTIPEHLRSASLGAGATPWQTAVRIVIPTAMSGLFSAMMVGLGRAVGETMIVLMAAGNTPVMAWNVFEGFRTLSANIAVELPEAVRNSTHFRTLFLAALTLFAMTFLVNTVAEIIRLRFRKRAYQL